MKRRWITNLFFAIGLCCCMYPIVSEMFGRRFQEQTVATYQKEAEESADFEELLQQARKYNQKLSQIKGTSTGSFAKGILSDASYKQQLNLNGIMAIIDIPKIDVHLPIRHGTDEKTLANGVGHFRDSSLPIGGEHTRCILTAHRGLPSAKLFTRLDELEQGDLFYLEVGKEQLAYEVCSVEVIEPKELNKLRMLPGKDIVSLVTCTPYGINTHRLVVNGERVPYEEEIRQSIPVGGKSVRELIFQGIPVLFMVISACSMIRERKKRRKEHVRMQKVYGNSRDRVSSNGLRNDARKSKRCREHSHRTF